ncbi:MAG: family 2 glycosyl transferase [Desulfobulbus sp.]|nr:MAG: family 2 glycosyl transferase [Desulfobulbus sp.]
MKISLIITTYNWKEALALSIKSALAQKQKPDEIIVADDGSDGDTADLIKEIAASTSLPIIHSWQEDEGFRLSASRNKAIARASGDYIVLVDGDIVQEEHFIYDHARFACKGFFVQGTRVLLNEKLAREVLREQRLMRSFCTKGVENKKNCIRSGLLANLFSFKSKKTHGVRTCNFAFWRKDAIAVNGFNEEFIGWGREDSEFTARLINYGLVRRNIKFNALAYHLYHTMNDRSLLSVNDIILQETVEQRRCWCERGIDQYLDRRKVE